MFASRRTFAFLSPLVLACSGGDSGSDDGANAARAARAMDTSLSFFVTSVGSGDQGGNLGGLEGADARCQQLADAVGAGSKTWRAYLSTSTVDARDRIGAGPWYNANGDQVAADVDSLHSDG